MQTRIVSLRTQQPVQFAQCGKQHAARGFVAHRDAMNRHDETRLFANMPHAREQIQTVPCVFIRRQASTRAIYV